MAEDRGNEQMSFTMIWGECALYPLLFALRRMAEMGMVVTIV